MPPGYLLYFVARRSRHLVYSLRLTRRRKRHTPLRVHMSVPLRHEGHEGTRRKTRDKCLKKSYRRLASRCAHSHSVTVAKGQLPISSLSFFVSLRVLRAFVVRTNVSLRGDREADPRIGFL